MEWPRIARSYDGGALGFSARSESKVEQRIRPHGFNIRERGEHGERLGSFVEARFALGKEIPCKSGFLALGRCPARERLKVGEAG